MREKIREVGGTISQHITSLAEVRIHGKAWDEANEAALKYHR